MTNAFIRQIAILMNGFLILSMLSINVESMSHERFVHDFQHEQHIEHAKAHQNADADDHDDHDFSVTQHQLLHSVDQLHYFSYPLLTGNIIALFLSTPQSSLVIQAVPLTSFDPPFRPPRSLVVAV